MKKQCDLRVVISAVLAMYLPAAALAGFVPLDNYDRSFDYALCCDPQGPAIATVYSSVEYDSDKGLYRYLYQIENVAPGYRINYFEIPIHEAPVDRETSSSYGAHSGYIFGYWDPLEQDGSVYGMAAFFTSAVADGANSCILKMESYEAPGQLSGLLSGFGPNGVVSLCGDVFVPAPEPTTLLLLASGAALVMRKKRN